MSEHAMPLTQPLPPPADAGLHCPRCDYNSPAAGTALPRVWRDVRLGGGAAPGGDLPRIYSMRVRLAEVARFFATWATVLFAPWIFARQATPSASTPRMHCPLSPCAFCEYTAGAVVWLRHRPFLVTWWPTAAIYIGLQAIWLAVLDASGRPRAPFGHRAFWLLTVAIHLGA